MFFNCFLDNCQANACAFVLILGMQPLEDAKDFGQVLAGYADAVVAYSESPGRTQVSPFDVYDGGDAGAAKFAGIAQ